MRIMIFGIPGSGKSTFAVKLSQRLGVPVFHLDKYFFTRGWQERDYDEFLNIQRGLVEYERLKKTLAKKHFDTNEYAHAKTSFIRKIEAKAREKN